MKRVFNQLREIVWPLLERSPEPPSLNDTSIIRISDENLEEAYKIRMKLFEAEDDRKKSIESKASLFISTVSVATSIVIGINALLSSSQHQSIFVRIFLILAFVLSLYTVRTIWFSIKTLERQNFKVLEFDDINYPKNKTDFYKNIIQKITSIEVDNRETINRKVDNLTLAQEYFKRAIIVICIYTAIILIYFFSINKSSGSNLNTQKDTVIVNIEPLRLHITGTIDSSILIRPNPKKD